MAPKEMKLKYVKLYSDDGGTYSAGTIAYLDDANSKRHSSRTVGDELSIVMVAEVA